MLNFFKNWSFTFICIVAIVATSCGFVSDKPPANSEIYRSTEMQTCKIDLEKLSQLLKSNQRDQILCLKDSFIQYTKYIKTTNPTSIQENELRDFVFKMYPDQKDSIAKALNILFQFDMILMRDQRGHISNENIIPFFDFLSKINQEAVIVNQILKDVGVNNFWKRREEFNSSIERFSEETLKILAKSHGTNQTLNIKYFILDLIKNFDIKEISPETIDTFLFSKKILMGGEKEFLSSHDIQLMIARLPQVLSVAFDIRYANEKNFNSDEEYARFNLINVRKLYIAIQFNQQDFKLFSSEEILRTLATISKNNNYIKFNQGIESLKSKLIGGDSKVFFLSDAKKMLDIYHDYAEKHYFNIVTYDEYSELFKKNEAITSIEELDLPGKYDLFSEKRITKLHQAFAETAINARYYRSEEVGVPYLGNEIKRNKFGFLQSALTTLITKRLIKGYGQVTTDGQLQISTNEFKLFLDTVEPILKEINLWSPDKYFHQSAVLMSDLFQNNSNGDLLVNPTEATEYAQLAFSSNSLSKKLNDELVPICNIGLNSTDPRFEPKCYNENVFDKLFNQLDAKSYLPNLSKYIEDTSPQELEAYLNAVEDFARENPSALNPIDKRDSGLIIGSILNIESTFIRFDTNGDNVLDYEELGKAYNVFKNITIEIAKLKPGQEIFAKSVFLYMITKARPPPSGTWTKSVRFYTYHKCVSSEFCRKLFLKKVEANRLQIAQLLSYVAKSRKATTSFSENDSFGQ